MADLQKMLIELNKRLEKDKLEPRLELRSIEHEGEIYQFLGIENMQGGPSLALSYWDDEEEWYLEYLLRHSHIQDTPYAADEIYARYLFPVLAGLLAAVYILDNDGEVIRIFNGFLPYDIPFTFSDEEKNYASTHCRVIAWEGEINDPEIICFMGSEREDVQLYKEHMFDN